MPDRLPSRAALLELRREHAVMDLGYRFLDEKRIALAQELIRLLREHSGLRRRWRAAIDAAAATMAAAMELHGLEGVQLYPAPDAQWRLRWDEQSFLGLPLVRNAVLDQQPGTPAAAACLASAVAQRCSAAFTELCRLAGPLAASEANLRRLADDFRRTQRRVKALEHVVLPAVRREERLMEGLIEEVEQEEAIRALLFAHAADMPARVDSAPSAET